jgi:hypothetical protein
VGVLALAAAIFWDSLKNWWTGSPEAEGEGTEGEAGENKEKTE